MFDWSSECLGKPKGIPSYVIPPLSLFIQPLSSDPWNKKKEPKNTVDHKEAKQPEFKNSGKEVLSSIEGDLFFND